MPISIETIEVCPMYNSNFEVASSYSKFPADASKPQSYLVQFHQGFTTCTCPAYRFSGDHGEQTCKHIQKVEQHGCFHHPQANDRRAQTSRAVNLATGEPVDSAWNEFDFDDNGIRWLSSGGPRSSPPTPCPGCGSPMLVTRTAV